MRWANRGKVTQPLACIEGSMIVMTLSGLSLRDLEYAIAVADLGSFGKAAEQCRVAQPSLSTKDVRSRNELPLPHILSFPLVISRNPNGNMT